ncbi:hypothetical protein H5T87_04320 [bacterium]|nr:hypothetical protein [bacterium]
METLGDRITFRFTLKGEIEPTYYYFVFINNSGDSTKGPFPIIVGPPWPINENTCATGYTHFVRLTMGQFQSFIYDESTKRDIASDPPPISGISPDQHTVEFTITRKWLGNPSKISFNIITIDYKPTDPGWEGTRQIDYLDSGPVEISTLVNKTYSSQTYGSESAGDVIPPLDIISWEVEVRLSE